MVKNNQCRCSDIGGLLFGLYRDKNKTLDLFSNFLMLDHSSDRFFWREVGIASFDRSRNLELRQSRNLSIRYFGSRLIRAHLSQEPRMDWPTIIAAGVTALIASSPAIAALFFGSRLRKVDTATRYQDLADKTIAKYDALVDCTDALRKGLRNLEDKVEALEDENIKKENFITRLLEYIDYLTDLMKKNGIVPERPRPTRKESQ